MRDISYESGSYYVFDRGYNAFKQLYRIHLMESYFVVRAKKNLQYKSLKWKRRLPKNVLTDAEIELTKYPSAKKYPGRLRLVRFHDQEQNRDFAFLTNATHLTALEVANLYKNRWQIELFFKWLKQHLKIKSFLGTSKNAVLTQIWVAMCYYLLLTYIKYQTKYGYSLLHLSRIIRETLFDRKSLIDILTLHPERLSAARNEMLQGALF